MSSYNSSDVFQQTASTQSNGYNVFPAAYQSKGVGGARKRSSSKYSRTNKTVKNVKKMKKGGNCGCKGNVFNLSGRGGAKKRNTKHKKTDKK
jgi:hypothetical protein